MQAGLILCVFLTSLVASELISFQVLFTADLKSFATYGLPTPASTAPPTPSPSESNPLLPRSPKKKVIPKTLQMCGILTPPMTPVSSPFKRKREVGLEEEDAEALSPTISHLCAETEAHLSIVERVKKRRRSLRTPCGSQT